MATVEPPQQQTWTKDTAKTRYSLVSSSTTHEDESPSAASAPESIKREPLEIQSIARNRPRKYIKLIICSITITLIVAPWIKMTRTVAKHGKDEPNPPALPESMVLIYPPNNEHERQALQSKLDTYSDPILYWEEFINSSFTSTALRNHPEFTHTSLNHFSPERTALLVMAGTYNLDVEIGYYTSLYGLGTHPTHVTFTGIKGPHVPALDKFTDRPPHGSGLNTFWRSVENIATKPREGMTWAVSQAAPLRRMHIMGDLNLFDADAWLSGGLGGNLLVEGRVNFGSQQQWIMRNARFEKGAVGGAWSLVFVGCSGGVPDATISLSEPGPAVSVEEYPRVRMEKPYIVAKERIPQPQQTADRLNAYEFELRVPKVMFGNDAIGPHFEEDNDEIRDFRKVKLGIPSTNLDSAKAAIENHSALQKALDQGKDLVLSPGIYPLSSSLEVKHSNQVILGLGYATLLAPTNSEPCIYIHPKVPGVRIAGVMLEASVLNEEGRAKNSSLLQWGDDAVVDHGDAANPGLLSDVFARVGGSSLDRTVSTDTMIIIHSGNIIGDNLWLWRAGKSSSIVYLKIKAMLTDFNLTFLADHVALHPGEKANFPQISPLYRQTVLGECKVKTGLVVNGANVTIVSTHSLR